MSDPVLPVPTTDVSTSAAVRELDTLLKTGATAAEKAAEASEPWLAAPFLRNLFEGLCTLVVNWIIQPALNTFTGKIIVELQEYTALKSAVAAQTALDAAAQSGSLNDQAEAQAILDAAVAKAAQYVGAVNP